jgi:ketosteroid isomerase-like protein
MVWGTALLLSLMLTAAPGDQAAIRAARIAQNEAIASGDLDRAAGFWTDDVTVRRALGSRSMDVTPRASAGTAAAAGFASGLPAPDEGGRD